MYSSQSLGESKTLWMGDIDHWMDETYVAGLFQSTGKQITPSRARTKLIAIPSFPSPVYYLLSLSPVPYYTILMGGNKENEGELLAVAKANRS